MAKVGPIHLKDDFMNKLFRLDNPLGNSHSYLKNAFPWQRTYIMPNPKLAPFGIENSAITHLLIEIEG